MRKTLGWLQGQITKHGWVKISSEPAKIAGLPQRGIFDVIIEKKDGSRHKYHIYNPAAIA